MEKVPVYLYPCAITTGFPTEDKEEGFIFQVVFEDRDSSDFKLSRPFLAYILVNAVCTRCLETIGESTHLSTCEKSAKTNSEWSSPRNRMCYISSEKSAEFRKFWNREKARYRSFDRKSKLRKNPLPPEEILLELKNQQGNRCYYCFNEFVSISSKFRPHLDHYVSVTNGGSNSIFNLVYACAWCNISKSDQNGEQYIDKWLPTRLFPSDIRREVMKMRQRVTEWRQQFAPKNLARVEKLAHEYDQRFPGKDSIEFDEWCDERLKLFRCLEQIRREIR